MRRREEYVAHGKAVAFGEETADFFACADSASVVEFLDHKVDRRRPRVSRVERLLNQARHEPVDNTGNLSERRPASGTLPIFTLIFACW